MDADIIKMIIVDDDQDDREFLHFLFHKNEKFEIIGCFDSAKNILNEINVNKIVPDILIMDLYMPMMSGEEVLTEILEKNSAPQMYTFIVSTTINEQTQRKFETHKNVRFLKKPTTLIEKNDLPGIILESLNKRNNRKI